MPGVARINQFSPPISYSMGLFAATLLAEWRNQKAADFGSPNLPRAKLETTLMRNVFQSTCFHLNSSTSPIRNPVTATSRVSSRVNGCMRQMISQAWGGVTRMASYAVVVATDQLSTTISEHSPC